MRALLIPLGLSAAGAPAQQRVLHFTRTSGYDHQTRGVSFAMFQGIAQELGATVDDDQSGDPFSDAAILAAYDVIVFSNTSGNAILNPQQRSNFEDWVAGRCRVLGIHAASDTYRHSTANGGGT
ncbi:MAG: ThuA domain-containing protein, partial [Flavobacteriales bacterium]